MSDGKQNVNNIIYDHMPPNQFVYAPFPSVNMKKFFNTFKYCTVTISSYLNNVLKLSAIFPSGAMLTTASTERTAFKSKFLFMIFEYDYKH